MEADQHMRLIGETVLAELDQVGKRTARGLLAMSSALLGDRGCCFTFHRVASSARWADLPNRDFYLDAGFLARLLTYLRQTGWAIVSMDEALRRSAQPGGGRFVNFSVDDCYRDTAEAVVPLFQRFGVPVTLFLQTGIPDGTDWLREAGLETILQERGHVTAFGKRYKLDTPEAKRAAFAAISAAWDLGDGTAEYLAFCRDHGCDPAVLRRQHAITWEMLDDMHREPLVEIGAHTVSHPHVARLDASAAAAEMGGSRARIEQVLQRRVRHFAFPYGRRADCGARDSALARQVGFVSAATSGKGLLRHGRDPFRLPRNTLNGAHRRIWLAEAHLTGATGAAARITGRA